MRIPRTIGFRIALGFGLLIVALILNTLLSQRIVLREQLIQDHLSRTLEPSIRHLIELRHSLHISADLFRALEYDEMEDPSGLVQDLQIHLQNRIPGIEREIEKLLPDWNPAERNRYDAILELINDSIYSRANLIKRNSIDDPENRAELLNPLLEDFDYTQDQLKDLINRFDRLVVQATGQSERANRNTLNTLLITGIIIALTGIIIAVLLNYSLVNPIQQYRDAISSMGRGVIPDRKFREGSDEMGQIGTALNSMISGFRNMANFSEEIGKRNFNAAFEPQSDEDILGNSLIRLRDDLQNAAIEEQKRIREDERRNWASHGIARFSEILREYSGEVQVLSDKLISELVNYLGARVGGIFLIRPAEEGSHPVELVAAYAYERKKHLQKTIEIKEGLIGRCIQEASTIYMTEIPEDYIRIKSGLGSDNPKSLLIVPIRLAETIIGVIEIASLEIMEDFQIEFVERIGSTIASSLTAKQSVFHESEKEAGKDETDQPV